MKYIPNFWEGRKCFSSKSNPFQCDFKSFKAWNFFDQSPEEVSSLFPLEENELKKKEREEYLSSFKIITIPKGTKLCHATPPFFRARKGDESDWVNDNFMWIDYYYPRGANTLGAWFTLGCSYGFGYFNILYELQDDIHLPFIVGKEKDFDLSFLEKDETLFSYDEDDYKSVNTEENFMNYVADILNYRFSDDKKNEYFRRLCIFFNLPSSKLFAYLKKSFLLGETIDIEKVVILNGEWNVSSLMEDSVPLDEYLSSSQVPSSPKKNSDLLRDLNYSTNSTSSHIFQGVEGWKKEGFSAIKQPPSDSEGILEKLISLGFDGYISCDLCEIVLSPKAMIRALTHPITFTIPKFFVRNKHIAKMISSIRKKQASRPLQQMQEFSESGGTTVGRILSIKDRKLSLKEKITYVHKIIDEYYSIFPDDFQAVSYLVSTLPTSFSKKEREKEIKKVFANMRRLSKEEKKSVTK